MYSIYIMFALSMQFPDPNLLSALCWIESKHKNVYVADDVGSPSYGPCQIKLATAQWMHHMHILDGEYPTAEEMKKEEVSVYYAALYLDHQLEAHKGDLSCAISAYNAGRCIKGNQKTYVKKVLARLEVLRGRTPTSLMHTWHNKYINQTIPMRSIQ